MACPVALSECENYKTIILRMELSESLITSGDIVSVCETYNTGGTVTSIRTVSSQTLTVYFGGKTFSLKDNASPLQFYFVLESHTCHNTLTQCQTNVLIHQGGCF